MDWIQFSIFLMTIMGMYMAMRSEMKDFHNAMKDFHGRLCILEERYLKIMSERK